MSEPISPRSAVEIALDRAVTTGLEVEHGSVNERSATIRCRGCGVAVTVPVSSRHTEMTARRVDAFVDLHRPHGGH